MSKQKSITGMLIEAMDARPEDFHYSATGHLEYESCVGGRYSIWEMDHAIKLSNPFSYTLSFFECRRMRKAIKRYKQWLTNKDFATKEGEA